MGFQIPGHQKSTEKQTPLHEACGGHQDSAGMAAQHVCLQLHHGLGSLPLRGSPLSAPLRGQKNINAEGLQMFAKSFYCFEQRATQHQLLVNYYCFTMIILYVRALRLINHQNIMPTPQLCVINNRLFWILGSLVAFYIPMLTMVVSFALTVQLLKRQALLAATPVPGGSQRRSEVTASAAVFPSLSKGSGVPLPHPSPKVPISPFPSAPDILFLPKRLCGFDAPPGGGRRTGADISPGSSVARQLTWRVSTTRRQRITPPTELHERRRGRRGRDASTQTPRCIAAETRRARRPLRLALPAPNALTLKFLTNRKKGRSLSANAVANEQKATKVLGLVFFTFVLCWAPFFLLNILFASCPACVVPEHVVDICLWLGYVSSTINPIIYTVFNRTFRAAFLRLLRCHCTRSAAQITIRSEGASLGSRSEQCGIASPSLVTVRGGDDYHETELRTTTDRVECVIDNSFTSQDNLFATCDCREDIEMRTPQHPLADDEVILKSKPRVQNA
ncbi:5-hydroxytryptamine receptor 2B [Eumeta japonica]|uniref:5-hydroxytryptamine receptor 2B n=1 Tax=Eumeta variegata TaxID=151549 RepID=A0A4C1UHV6_EUMVA|nr:5-hydroxytryptamine receptor 2B [Eumeta japonica]